MIRLNEKLEFFTVKEKIFVKSLEDVHEFREDSYDLVGYVVESMQEFYPKAYAALAEFYKRCAPNLSYYKFRIAARFIKCNFAALDDIPDMQENFDCSFEYVNCPLYGECPLEGVVCHPEFNHKLSPAELRVLKLIYNGVSESEIANQLFLSPHTVHAHIRNAYARLGIHSRGEFVKYAAKNKLF